MSGTVVGQAAERLAAGRRGGHAARPAPQVAGWPPRVGGRAGWAAWPPPGVGRPAVAESVSTLPARRAVRPTGRRANCSLSWGDLSWRGHPRRPVRPRLGFGVLEPRDSLRSIVKASSTLTGPRPLRSGEGHLAPIATTTNTTAPIHHRQCSPYPSEPAPGDIGAGSTGSVMDTPRLRPILPPLATVAPWPPGPRPPPWVAA